MNIVSNNKFILSDDRKYRIRRHLFFWAFWGLWLTITRLLNPKVLKETGHLPNLLQTIGEVFFLFLPQVILVYPLLYFILPRYVFDGKYIKASAWMVVFMVLTISASAALLVYVPWHKVWWLSSTSQLFKGVPTSTKLMKACFSSTQGNLHGSASASSFNYFKAY